MDYNGLYQSVLRKKSFLCVGLDPDISQIPSFLKEREYPLFEFNKAIIDATINYTVAYKPNTAFYEAEGASGWKQLEMTVEYIKERDSSLFVIADAKRGDIGNTAERYAAAFFERMHCDAVTVAPYMGRDSAEAFLGCKDKWAIILALTSNKSAGDFEMCPVDREKTPLYRRVIESAMEWGSCDNLMFVVGATRPEKLAEIRSFCPDHFLLVPGVGAQGGTVKDVVKYGINSRCGLLINISRDIIYAWKKTAGKDEKDFALAAGEKAASVAAEMAGLLIG